jgi:hypothetical protein
MNFWQRLNASAFEKIDAVVIAITARWGPHGY